MRTVLLSVTLALVLAVGCTESNDGSDGETSFRLSGRVTDTATGFDTSGIPDVPDMDANDGTTGGDRTDDENPSEAGSLDLAIADPNALESEVRGCGAGGVYTVVFTPDTTIVPSAIVGNDDFPENLEDETVDVTGTMYRDGGQDDCQLVASSISATSVDADNPRSTLTPGPIPAGSTGGSAGADGSPGPGGAQQETASPTPAPNQQ